MKKYYYKAYDSYLYLVGTCTHYKTGDILYIMSDTEDRVNAMFTMCYDLEYFLENFEEI